jgi:hypothetical protein
MEKTLRGSLYETANMIYAYSLNHLFEFPLVSIIAARDHKKKKPASLGFLKAIVEVITRAHRPSRDCRS